MESGNKFGFLIAVILCIVFIPSFAFGAACGGTCWVSPAGSATWPDCKGETDPGVYCSNDAALNGASPGDTIYYKDGNYTLGEDNYGALHFKISGTGPGSGRVIFSAAPGEHPILKPTEGQTKVKGFYLGDIKPINYIKIDGFTFKNFSNFGIILNASHHNEITNCTFTSDAGISGALVIWSLCDTYICPSTHNWIHHNTFSKAWGGGDCLEGADLLQVGIAYSSGRNAEDNFNTIENNYFEYSGHGAVNSYGRYVVFKNNVMQNSPWHGGDTGACNYPAKYANEAFNGKYGHRNFQISDDYGRDGIYNLVENNRAGHASTNPGNDGADNFDIAGPKNIVRYNFAYNSMNNGLVFKYADAKYNGAGGTGSRNNKVYNNTIYYSGYGYAGDPPYNKRQNVFVYISYANPPHTGNIFKNNIVYDSSNADFNNTSLITTENNWCTSAETGCTGVGDPLFLNPDLSDPTSSTLPNLGLQSTSPAIDGGTHLTQANGAGTNSITLAVDGNDSLFFQDGTWGSDLARGVTLFPDWIAIGTVTNVVQISSIDYATNTITLASAMTWEDDAPIWLYKKSDGTRVLYGSAPDYGAYEYEPVGQVTGSFGGNLH